MWWLSYRWGIIYFHIFNITKVFFIKVKIVFRVERYVDKIDDIYNYGLKTLSGRCGGSLAARQTSRAEVPGSNPASPTRINVHFKISG